MFSRFSGWIRNEISGWQTWEIVWISAAAAAITGLSIFSGESALGIASALTGTLYTMLAGKGKISCYIFGIFNSAAYGYIAFSGRVYGDAVLNILIYLPMMFAGIICWNRKRDAGGDVIKRDLSRTGKIITAALSLFFTAAGALILKKTGGAQPLMDSATTVLSIVAMVLTLMRCAEQWLLWIAVNTISVVMWSRIVYHTGNGEATLLWWIFMLLTGVVFFIRWNRSARKKNHQ